jgi:hypothetical protein
MQDCYVNLSTLMLNYPPQQTDHEQQNDGPDQSSQQRAEDARKADVEYVELVPSNQPPNGTNQYIANTAKSLASHQQPG